MSAPWNPEQEEKPTDNADELGNDAEGVWSPDIEQSFQEALAIYPPCGRRKIILSDEGKMYGRNELIARYIKLRTGKTRTRKQVSSHMQVLSRRKCKDIQNQFKVSLRVVNFGVVTVSGRNELIARYIQLRTGKTRSRKQVSSHIQVLSRRKCKEIQNQFKDQASKDKALQSMAAMSSAQIVSASAIHNKTLGAGLPGFGPPGIPGGIRSGGPYSGPPPFWPHAIPQGDVKPPYPTYGVDTKPPNPQGDMSAPAWQGRSIAGPKLRLVEFSAFLEQQRDPESYNKHLFVHIGTPPTYADPLLEAVDVRQIYDKFPEKKGGLKELYDKGPQSGFFLVKFWADLNTNVQDESGTFYGVTSLYESSENVTIQCSTKVCSFGKQVVEKVETEFPRFENGHWVYRIHRSPMCEYMINFIHKLKHLPEKYMMNSVLENFTILQVVTNRETQETLLCIAYVFEVSTSEHGAQHHIYRLVKD